MAVYIEMPKLSDTMTEGTLLKWRKKVGDKVVAGDILAEVETDKATMEMEAFDDGVLTKIYVQEGQTVAIGQRMAVLLEPGEEMPADADPAPAPAAAKTAEAAAPAAKAAGAPRAAAPSGVRVKATPLARKVADAKGVDLSKLTGTGPGGRIVVFDVEASTGAPAAKPGAPRNTGPAIPVIPVIPPGEGDERIPLSGMRRVIADRLLASKTQIPHFYQNSEVDVAELMRVRAEANAAAEKDGQGKITVNDFVLKAVAIAATRVPKVNAAYAGDSIIQYGSVQLAVAVSIDEGLITPVIRDAQKKSIREISDAMKDLATRARGKKLKPDEYQGGTITVSNMGAYGIQSFQAIVNPPQSVIISVGAAVKKPVVNEAGEIVVGHRMNIGMSCDHRVVDGAVAAAFFNELKKLIEEPASILI
jgi:pyruvate dehydrogenase E2 component (dihydrolipoamide acetyltransferase)